MTQITNVFYVNIPLLCFFLSW